MPRAGFVFSPCPPNPLPPALALLSLFAGVVFLPFPPRRRIFGREQGTLRSKEKNFRKGVDKQGSVCYNISCSSEQSNCGIAKR